MAQLGFQLAVARGANRNQMFQLIGLYIGREIAIGDFVMYVELTPQFLFADPAYLADKAIARPRL